MTESGPGPDDARSSIAAGVSTGDRVRAELPGLLFCIGIAVLARLCAQGVPGLSAAAVAIALGIVAGVVLPRAGAVQPGIRRAATTGLEIMIVLLGLTIPRTGLPPLPALVGLCGVMALTLGVAALTGRWTGLGARAGLLGGMGSAVCGSAAIAAAAPLLRVQPAVVGAALASINLLSAAGMIALPALALALGVNAEAAGWWTGGSLQAVGQAVGAGFAVSVPAGETATVVKMFRVLTLAGLLPLLGLLGRTPGRTRLPWFVTGFLLTAAWSALRGPVDAAQTPVALLLAMALVAIGARIRPKDLLEQGPRVLVLCLVAFAVQLAGVLVLVASGLTG